MTSIRPAGPPHTYLGVANSLRPAIHTLLENRACWGIPISILIAHALECLLKAFLSKDGDDSGVRGQAIQHNLQELWKQAASLGLSIDADPPEWVVKLGGLHQRPYRLRYSTQVHGVVTPSPKVMVTELDAVFEVVRKSVLGA